MFVMIHQRSYFPGDTRQSALSKDYEDQEISHEGEE